MFPVAAWCHSNDLWELNVFTISLALGQYKGVTEWLSSLVNSLELSPRKIRVKKSLPGCPLEGEVSVSKEDMGLQLSSLRSPVSQPLWLWEG